MFSARTAALALCAFALGAGLHPAAAHAAHAAPPPADTLRLPGLSAPVEILRDRWGVNHIYARTEPDLFFAQGYAAAHDRLFQFEIWRRQATGTVAEILGPRELERDIGTRLTMFRGDLDAELAHYHPRGKAIVESYVRGVNAAIDEALRHPESLPIEFRLLGIRPRHWTPAVVISRHQGLLGNLTTELRIGRQVAALGPAKVKELNWFHPGDPDVALDSAVDGALLSRDILALYDAFRRPIRFEPSDLVAAYRGDEAAYRRLASSLPPAELDLTGRGESVGSNNWVVAGSRTATGRPLLANDPHRVQGVPSLRYFVHLVAPGWDVIGGGEPVLPGVSIGHNRHGAWGLTVFTVDGEDLYVYDTDPANPDRYRYRGAWESMKVIRDTIAVKGGSPVAVSLRYTRHGPVLYQDSAHHKAYALRAAWMDIGAAPYLASLRMDQATSWEEFREACSYSRIPGENMVWVDTAGRIGWQAVGVAPRRPNWSGLVPVPGDGRYEWNGYLPIRELPHDADPPRGFIATANQNDVPPGYPYLDAVGRTWADPFRFDRISEVLGAARRLTPRDMARLQQDELSIPARTLVPLLASLRSADARTTSALDTLRHWDYVLDRNSVAAGIYAMWERRLSGDVSDLLVPASAQSLFGNLQMTRIIQALRSPDARFGDDAVAGRDALLLRSLEEATAELTKRLGPDMSRWKLGAFHYALLHHPLSAAVSADVRAKLDVGPLPRGGNSYTVNATGGGDNQTSGASFRIVADASDWDRSLATNNPGQSGDPASPHYRDLFPLWAAGEYFPLLYSRPKVDEVTEKTTVLAPAAGP